MEGRERVGESGGRMWWWSHTSLVEWFKGVRGEEVEGMGVVVHVSDGGMGEGEEKEAGDGEATSQAI